MEDKRSKIIRTATRLFTENGFHATPTSLIARESGVAVGTLFHHFKNKEVLINSIYFDIKKEMGSILLEALPENVSFRESAETLWRTFINWGVDKREEFGFITQFYNSPFISNVTREEVERGFDFINPLFEKARNESLIKKIDAGLFQDFWFSSVSCALNYLIKNPDENIASVVRISFSLFWEGVSVSL